MNFLHSLRSDLLSKRLLPLVVLACVGLAGAIVYVAGGSNGSTSSTTPVPAPSNLSGASSALSSVSPAPSNPNSNETVAETTAGRHYQRQGKTHNPFKEQPRPAAPKATTAATSSSSSSSGPSSSPSTGSGQGSSQGSQGGKPTGGAAPTQPVSPPKPVTTYTANVELGPAPTVAGEAPKLTLYKKLKLNTSLPNKTNPLVVLKSASLNLKALDEGTLNGSVTFELASAPILKGPGVCMPSTTQCESIKLALGQVEELQVLEPSGQNVTYLLRPAFIFRHTS